MQSIDYYESSLKNIQEVGDVYAKRTRFTRLAGELEALKREQARSGGPDEVRAIDRMLDKVKYAVEMCDDQISTIVEQQETPGQEEVGDIDDLLGGLTLDAEGPPRHQQQQSMVKQICVRPGRRYKKAIRKNPANNGNHTAVISSRLRDAESDAEDEDSPHRGRRDTVVASLEEEDEEGKRYRNVDVMGKDVLKVDIPVNTAVVAQALDKEQMSPGTSGSTRACGGRADMRATSTTDEYDSDGSITSPAVVPHTTAASFPEPPDSG